MITYTWRLEWKINTPECYLLLNAYNNATLEFWPYIIIVYKFLTHLIAIFHFCDTRGEVQLKQLIQLF